MGKRKIVDQITVNEMLEMRASGMTNQEIAASLEISYPTICRHIGRAPKEIRGTTAAWALPTPKKQAPVQEQKTQAKPPILFKDQRVVTGWTSETGAEFEADIDVLRGKIEITGTTGEETWVLKIPQNDALDLASFIGAVVARFG